MDDGNAPATKQDIARLDQSITRLDQSIDQLRSDLIERITYSETKLLKAFYAFAESNQKRVAEIEGDNAAIHNRLSTVEARLLEVEKRLNMPPHS